MIELCNIPIQGEYREEIDTPDGLWICNDILKETTGEFVLIQEENDKFFFLREKSCNITQICNKYNWCVIHESWFNKNLSIGVGLADIETTGSYIGRVKDEATFQMWEDILKFVFFKNFSVPSYFLYSSRFKGELNLDGAKCYYIHDYYPFHYGKVGTDQIRARHSIYAFKDGEKPYLWAKIFSLCIEATPSFKEIRDNAILIPIPASTQDRNIQRYAWFCRLLSSLLKIEDGFRAIWIEHSREQLKGTVGQDKLENLTFNAKYIEGKEIILCDDVTTTGQSFIQMKQKFMELGAKSVMGVFMGRTIETS